MWLSTMLHLLWSRWQTDTVLELTSPHSHQVQLGDGTVWQYHINDVLRNTPNESPAEPVPSEQSTVHNPTLPGNTANSQPPVSAGPVSSGQVLDETQESTSEGSHRVEQTPPSCNFCDVMIYTCGKTTTGTD